MNSLEKPSKENLEKWHNDPKNWKLGMFYYNPEDPRGLVSKRIVNIGATINFAHKSTVKVFVIALITFIAIFVLAIYLSK
jgi:uncharacterized membrane protein